MIKQTRLSHPTSSTFCFRLGSQQLHQLLLSMLITFASMALAGAPFPDLTRTVFTLIAVALLTGGAIAARRLRDLFISFAPSSAEVNAGLLSLAFGAWSVFLLLIFISWQVAAIAALALPCLVAISLLGERQESGGRLLLESCVTALPAIIGGAAATATVELPALVLFAIIFFWSLTHARVRLWRDESDDTAGGLTISAADEGAPKRLLFYVLQLVIMSMFPILILPLTQVDKAGGVVYPVVAIGLGIMIVTHASRLARVTNQSQLRRLADTLSLYPFLLVMALVADFILQ